LGGAPTAGCRFRAMMRPCDPKDCPEGPEAEMLGGGGTTRGATLAVAEDCPPPIVRCSATCNCGAGAITLLWPTFSSPSRRVVVFATAGGGATTAGCGASNAAAWREVRRSGGGATTAACKIGSSRCARCSASGGGATTGLSILGASRLRSAAGVSGTAGMANRGFSNLSDQATIFGKATSCLNLMFGGVTTV